VATRNANAVDINTLPLAKTYPLGTVTTTDSASTNHPIAAADK
jgi:membrane protein YdbS with pleckstrin-like domain